MTSRTGRFALVAVPALALGGLTSILQTRLSGDLAPLVNSSGTWCAVAFALALLARGPRAGALCGAVALAGLVVGYYAVAHLRGYPVGSATVVFWLLAALTAGPALGLGAQWLGASGRLRPGWAVGVLPGVLVGEGLSSLVRVADSTGSAYWIGEAVVGVLLFVGLARTGRRSAADGAAAGAALILVGAAVTLAALADPVSLVG